MPILLRDGCRCFNCNSERKVVEILRPDVGSFMLCELCIRLALEIVCKKPDGPPVIVTAKPRVSSIEALDTPERAQRVCDAFLAGNGIGSPTYKFLTSGPTGIHGRYNRVTQVVEIYTDTCIVGGQINSHPGHWEDLTVLGVTAHEVGHHVEKARGWRGASNGMYDAWMKERPLRLNSKQSRHEDFADCLMLLITNPDLLMWGCPLRYEYLTRGLGLRPVESRGWRIVIGEAPASVIKMIEERLHTVQEEVMK